MTRLLSRKEFIARARHLVWIGYQIGVGQDFNRELNYDQLQSLLNGVDYQDAHPDTTPEENHDNWMKEKTRQGWVYGPVKDFNKKTHPDLVPFAELPWVEQRKDIMDKEAHLAAVALHSWVVEDREAPTCDLVEELSKREGVEKIVIPPYEPYSIITPSRNISVDGPAVILEVVD